MSYFNRQRQMQRVAKGWGKEINEAWDETEHPRDERGRWTDKGGTAAALQQAAVDAIHESVGKDPLDARLEALDAADAAAKQAASAPAAAESSEGYKELERSRAYKNPHGDKIGIGTVLRRSWGYDQTNIDYYEVTGMSPSGKTVTLREISEIDVGQTRKDKGPMDSYKRALPGAYVGKPFQRRVTPNGRVNFNSYSTLGVWDGNDDYYSWYH